MPSCLIIGAGIAGITVARELKNAGWQATLLDKGRGVGGRMATRRIEQAVFDHGAQYVSARSSAFDSVLNQLNQLAVADLWHLEENHQFTFPRWKGITGMSAIPKYLTKELDCKLQQKVVQINHNNEGLFEAITETGEVFNAERLVITIPAPQALELLVNSNIDLFDGDASILNSIEYHPCIAVMAVLSSQTAIPHPGGLMLENEDIAWIADNYQKGISTQFSATIHASHLFSHINQDNNLHEVGQHLIKTAHPWIKENSVVNFQTHRWKYSNVKRNFTQSFLKIIHPFEIYFGGDAFGSGNVEGAFLSGLKIARSILEA